MLRRLLRELTAIADLRQRYATGVAAESALQVLIEPVQTVGRLATEPKTRWSEFALSEDEALFYQEAAAEMLGGVQ